MHYHKTLCLCGNHIIVSKSLLKIICEHGSFLHLQCKSKCRLELYHAEWEHDPETLGRPEPVKSYTATKWSAVLWPDKSDCGIPIGSYINIKVSLALVANTSGYH